MAGPIAAAGGAVEPSEYAALSMDTQFTGIWTQRSPLRDADVPYLYRKFYSASRFDSIIDGLNREVSARLTDVRRPGSTVWNANTWSPVNCFYSFKAIQQNIENIYVIVDTATTVYEAAVNGVPTQNALFTKSTGANKTRFLGIGSTLYMGDGVDQKKWLAPGAWKALTSFAPGTLIAASTPPGNLQMALGGITLSIIATGAVGSTIIIYTDPTQVPLNFTNLVGVSVTFSGLTSATFLNGNTYPVASIISTTDGIFTITLAGHGYNETVDTGSGTTGNGITGPSTPAFSGTEFVVVSDSGQQWKMYGTGLQNWGLAVPTKAPTLTPQTGVRYWQPNTALAAHFALLDSNGNIEIGTTAGTGISGQGYPTWNSANNVYQISGETGYKGVKTIDAGIQWFNAGPINTWGAGLVLNGYYVVLDSNQNLQVLLGGSGTTGATQPAWNATLGGTTTDNTVTWTNYGPGTVLSYQTIQYAISTHAVDGSVSTASPVAKIPGGILGPVIAASPAPTQYILITAPYTVDSQIDQVWLWRTPQGQSTLLLEDQIPADALAGTFTYYEIGIPDTSTNGVGSLNALIAAPIASANNPPIAGTTAPEYHAGRVWYIYGNTVGYTGGPNTLVGNGNTAFPPLNTYQFPEAITRLKSFTLNGGGLLVIGTSNIYLIGGNGTSTSPFTSPQIYMAGTGVLSYDEIDVVGSTIYAFTSRFKAVSLDPSAGYTEIGFPIGDQFLKVTTGGISAPVYSPGFSFVSWHERFSGETGLFVSDGTIGWFRYSPISPPESGDLWSPRAAIVGGTSAVQSIEVTPGNFLLLIGPPVSSGPILFRDVTTNADNGTAFEAYDTKGSIALCETGEVAEIAHIALKSVAVGARPQVSILLDELGAGISADGVQTIFDPLFLDEKHEDPPNLKSSITMYSDRYVALQNGITPKCETFQLKIDYGVQNFPDELLKFAVYGAVFKERRQQ